MKWILIISISVIMVIGILWVSRKIFYQAHQKQAADLKSPLFFVQKSGPGPTILFFHGLTGSHHYWDEISNLLQSKHATLAFDLLGFGQSPWPKIDYTLEDHLSALDQTWGDFSKQQNKIILVGHSMGALLALQFAKRHPEVVSKIILLAPPIYESREELKEKLRTSSIFVSAMSADPVISPMLCHLHEALGPLFVFLARPLLKGLPVAVQEDVGKHTWQSFNGTLDNVVLGLDVKKLLAEFDKKNVLAIFGAQDVHTKNLNFEELGQQMVIKKIPGTHNFPLERGSEIAFEIQKFIEP